VSKQLGSGELVPEKDLKSTPFNFPAFPWQLPPPREPSHLLRPDPLALPRPPLSLPPPLPLPRGGHACPPQRGPRRRAVPARLQSDRGARWGRRKEGREGGREGGKEEGRERERKGGGREGGRSSHESCAGLRVRIHEVLIATFLFLSSRFTRSKPRFSSLLPSPFPFLLPSLPPSLP